MKVQMLFVNIFMEDICACLKEMNVSHKLLYFLV